MSPEQEVWNAERARQIIEDPLVVKALNELEKAATDNLEVCPINDVALRDRLWMLFCTTRRFRRTFLTMMETGKLAQAELNRQSLLQQAKQAVWRR